MECFTFYLLKMLSKFKLTCWTSIFDVRGHEEETFGLRGDVNQHRHGDQPGEQEADAVQRDVQLQRLVQFHSLPPSIHLEPVPELPSKFEAQKASDLQKTLSDFSSLYLKENLRIIFIS